MTRAVRLTTKTKVGKSNAGRRMLPLTRSNKEGNPPGWRAKAYQPLTDAVCTLRKKPGRGPAFPKLSLDHRKEGNAYSWDWLTGKKEGIPGQGFYMTRTPSSSIAKLPNDMPDYAGSAGPTAPNVGKMPKFRSIGPRRYKTPAFNLTSSLGGGTPPPVNSSGSGRTGFSRFFLG